MEGLICPQHKEEIVTLCLETNCQSKVACYKCLAYSHRKCENIVVIEDIVKRNLDPILRIPQIRTNPKYSDLKVLVNLASKKDIPQEIEDMFTDLLDRIANKLTEVKDRMIANFNKEFSIKDVSDKVLDILSLKEIEENLGKFSCEELEKELLKSKTAEKPKEKVPECTGLFSKSITSNVVNPVPMCQSMFGINLTTPPKNKSQISQTDQLSSLKHELVIGKALENVKNIENSIIKTIDNSFESVKIARNSALFMSGSINGIELSDNTVNYKNQSNRFVLSRAIFNTSFDSFKYMLSIDGQSAIQDINFGIVDAAANTSDIASSLDKQAETYVLNNVGFEEKSSFFGNKVIFNKMSFEIEYTAENNMFIIRDSNKSVLKDFKINSNFTFKLLVFSNKINTFSFKKIY